MTRAGLSTDDLDELAAARLLALEQQPYLATALFEIVPVAAPGLGTFAVDAAWRLYLDPVVLHRWGAQASAGVLLHEVGHLLREHHARHAEQPRHDHWRWNLAADAEINDDLLAAGVELPGRPITPAWLGQPDGGLAEQYFAALLADADPRPDPSCGSGSGGHRLPVELDEQDDELPGRTAIEAEMIRRKVAEEVAGPYAGTAPGGWRRWATRALEPPVIDWRRRLRGVVRRGLSVHAGQLDTTYRRPGRRRILGVVTPGMVQPALRVGVVLDTSGSMDPTQLGAALAELDGLCRRAGLGPGDLVVVTADVEVHEVGRLRHAGQLVLRGGGGTDLRPALAHLATHRRRPAVVVVLTDGFTPWPVRAPAGTTVIAVLLARRDGLVPADPPSYVEVVRLDPVG